MSQEEYDLLKKQYKETPLIELKRLLDHCQRIHDEGRKFDVSISLHVDLKEGMLHLEPVLKLDVHVTPLSPVDLTGQEWFDAEHCTILKEWAETQPSFRAQINYTIGILEREIHARKSLISHLKKFEIMKEK